MKDLIHKHLPHEKLPFIFAGVFLVVFVALILGGYVLFANTNALKKLTVSNQSLTEKMANLEAVLATTTLTSAELAKRLEDQQNRAEDLEDTIDDIGDTVGDLEKLSKTDKELLQKYSKVYFLSDNFVPLRLSTIDKDYFFDQTKIMQFHTSAMSFLEDMLNEAEDDNISLKIISAYRSFGTQSSLKAGYSVTYGAGANAFSADQGYSEHQLGTTLDLTTASQGNTLLTSFETTPAFTWLTQNAYKYGFVLSYPKNNIYYQYEPWHWRFVGVKLATYLYKQKKNFSDLDQREIDTYLVRIFD